MRTCICLEVFKTKSHDQIKMAASISSCDSSSAPTDFRLFTSVDDSQNGNICISVAVERCALCSCSKRPFYCIACIRRGLFHHSKSPPSDRYCDKLRKWHQQRQQHHELLERVCERLKQKEHIEKKKTELSLVKESIEVLRQSLIVQNHKLATERARLQKQQEENRKRQARRPRLNEKKQRVLDKIKKAETSTSQNTSALSVCLKDLQEVRKGHAVDLVTHIFPITRIQARSSDVTSPGDALLELAEAQQMSYIQGRWVQTDSICEEQFQVVEPTLPGNGDYSAYGLLLMTNKDAVSVAESEPFHHRPETRIGAALSYTAQLVASLSELLDVTIPRRTSYGEFCSKELTEKQFQRAVRRLNQNILLLCFSQNIDPGQLNPVLSIHNTLLLLEAPDLGRSGPYEVHSDILKVLYDNSCEESDPDMSEGEEIDGAGADWERVPVTLPEADMTARGCESGGDTSSDSSTQLSTITSTAGGLMSSAAASVASFWRGFRSDS